MRALNTFPISLKVQGRDIVIIGGGAEAVAKVRLAIKTSARVIVLTSDDVSLFDGLAVELRQRAPEPQDFDNAAMVFVTGDDEAGAFAQAEARRRGIPLNVVDVPESCDFYTPAIINRAPLSIAVSTEGDAPVLARQVRAKIEAMLSPNLGDLVHLAGRVRDKVAKLLLQPEHKRRFYEDLVSSTSVQSALDIGASDGLQRALGLLDEHAAGQGAEGQVWLIGAGPGAEDLLTLRAQRLLQEADVIVHDQLVPELVVQMGRRDADRICVGKSKGHHSFSQSRINALLVRLAKKGLRVARLKSGDPMVFGRAGEELAALRKHNIAVQIVPGVTAALAAAADAQVPVTLRKVSSGFVMATAHGADDAELAHWAELSQSGMTLGLYMGKSIAGEVAGKLMQAGLGATLPVGIVVNAGRADASSHFGTLCELENGELNMEDGPGLILIGQAVAYGDWEQAQRLAAQAMKVA